MLTLAMKMFVVGMTHAFFSGLWQAWKEWRAKQPIRLVMNRHGEWVESRLYDRIEFAMKATVAATVIFLLLFIVVFVAASYGVLDWLVL